ncbi:MAG TPA: TOBE domain-containing protein [Chthoniobacteraceae bacterium]|jgi:molybdate transport system regulatory protein|nr:TOBE domain-containing protein [Chthoniobacteraceae bacterium]
MSTSIRNQLPGTITEIISDKVVSEIVVSTAAGEVTSIITTGSVKRMKLKKGDAVFVLVKATEVSIAKDSVTDKRAGKASSKAASKRD